MKILQHPSFQKELKKIKNTLRAFEVVELEKFLVSIEKNYKSGKKSSSTNIYKKGKITPYWSVVITYEYDETQDTLIFWDIR